MQKQKEEDDENYFNSFKNIYCSAVNCSNKILKMSSIQCKMCDGWFHMVCSQLDKELFNMLKVCENKAVLWFCVNCLKIWTNKCKANIFDTVLDLNLAVNVKEKLHKVKISENCNGIEEIAECSSTCHKQKIKKNTFFDDNADDENGILSAKQWFVEHNFFKTDNVTLDSTLSIINKASLDAIKSCTSLPFTCGFELLTSLSAKVSLCLLQNNASLEDEEEATLGNYFSCYRAQCLINSDNDSVTDHNIQTASRRLRSRIRQLQEKKESDYSSDSSSVSIRLSSLVRTNGQLRGADFLVDKWDRRGAPKYAWSSHDSDDNFIVTDSEAKKCKKSHNRLLGKKQWCDKGKARRRIFSESNESAFSDKVEQSSSTRVTDLIDLHNDSDHEGIIKGCKRSKKFRIDDAATDVNNCTHFMKENDSDVSENEVADLRSCDNDLTPTTSDESLHSDDDAQTVLKKKRRLSTPRGHRGKRKLRQKLFNLRTCRQSGKCVKLIDINSTMEDQIEEVVFVNETDDDDDEDDFIASDGSEEEKIVSDELDVEDGEGIEKNAATVSWWQIEIANEDLCSRNPQENFKIVLTAYMKWAAGHNVKTPPAPTSNDAPIPTPQSYAEAVAFLWLDRELGQYIQMISSCALTENFLILMLAFPGFCNKPSSYRTECEACCRKHTRTTQIVKFDGVPYSADTMEEEPHRLADLPQQRTFNVGRDCALRSYHHHKLIHYRWTLLHVTCPLRLNQEIMRLRNGLMTESNQVGNVVNQAVEACLQDVGWTNQLFREFESIDVYEKFMKNYFMNE